MRIPDHQVLGVFDVKRGDIEPVFGTVVIFYPGPAERNDPPNDHLLQLRLDGALKVMVLATSLSARNPWPQSLLRQLKTGLSGPIALDVIAQPAAGSRWGLAQVSRIAAARPAGLKLGGSQSDP